MAQSVNQNSNGQATMANSAPVAIASDQPTLQDGTNAGNILKSDGTAVGQNAQMVAPTYLQQTLSITGNGSTAVVDAGNYEWVTIQTTAVGAGATLTWQCSGDNSTWLGFVLDNTTVSAPGGSTSATSTGSVDGPLRGRYFRINVTGYSSGTYAVTVTFHTFAKAKQGISVNNIGLMPAATSLNTFSIHSTTNATTTPTSSTAYISMISISAEVAGTTSTVTIQDKQGTPLKLVNGFSTTALTTTPTVVNFQTPVKMTSGIDIITAGAVAATIDVWINYYQ